MSNSRLCKVLGIEKPIIQGPMAWTSTAPLAAAVSEAGGLGVLAQGFSPEIVEEQIAATRKLTSKPFGINVLMIPEILDGITELLVRVKPPVIYTGSLKGLNLEFIGPYFSKWKEAGIKIVVKVFTIQDAITAEKAGADAVIMKGWEGGGFISQEATTILVPQAVDCISIPVVASGGIADGRGMAAAIALGADGIEMGTVFMCAEETMIPPNVKQAMLKTGDMETVIMGISTDMQFRQIKNKLSDKILEIESNNIKKEAAEKVREILNVSLKVAMLDGDIEEKGSIMTGQVIPMVTEIKSAKDIINDVLEGYNETVSKMVKFEV